MQVTLKTMGMSYQDQQVSIKLAGTTNTGEWSQSLSFGMARHLQTMLTKIVGNPDYSIIDLFEEAIERGESFYIHCPQ